MILRNAKVFDREFNPVPADILIRARKIEAVAPDLGGEDALDLGGEDALDLGGCLISPGFVDIHTHGCAGADTCDADRGAIEKMAAHLIGQGVTSFCPTTMTVSMNRIARSVEVVRDCMEHPPEGAEVLGVDMEGPYISPGRKGAQSEEHVRRPDWREFRQFYKDSGGVIRLVALAPEQEGGADFIKHAGELCRVTFAHSDADYAQAKTAFDLGIRHVTHFFNAMTGMNHRAPGAVGAVFDDERVRAELICDGFHVHPAVLRAAFRLLGEDRTVIVSDSMRAAGLPDGVSELGGQRVFVRNGQARLADGTIAGSTTNLYDEVKNLIRFGVPLRQIIKSATINPAAEIGAADRIGSIEPGKDADLVVLDEAFGLKLVIAKGRIAVDNRA